MPTLESWKRTGLFRRVRSVMPSVTNVNNASICCGAWPSEHGITGNSYLDERTGREEYMEDGGLLQAPTLFERAARFDVRSALLSSKKKTTTLLARGAEVVLTPERASAEWVRLLGPPPGIYSREVNYWVIRAGLHLLRTRTDLGCLYIHTTDYAMHMWPPEARELKEHMAQLDALFGELASASPDAAILLTADHGMNHKGRCWDLVKACGIRGRPIRSAISAGRDAYLKHHGGFSGAAWVYLNSRADADPVASLIASLPGVERVLTRAEAARRFHLMPERIGQLIVLGDRDTVFGPLEQETRQLPGGYRSHGSLHETDVPLFIHNAQAAPAPDYFQYNLDIGRWLYRSGKPV